MVFLYGLNPSVASSLPEWKPSLSGGPGLPLVFLITSPTTVPSTLSAPVTLAHGRSLHSQACFHHRLVPGILLLDKPMVQSHILQVSAQMFPVREVLFDHLNLYCTLSPIHPTLSTFQCYFSPQYLSLANIRHYLFPVHLDLVLVPAHEWQSLHTC